MDNTQSVDDVLRSLYYLHGTLKPDLVIEAARDPGSVLHNRFNWDVGIAAHEHWRYVARGIIRSVRVEVRTETTTVSCVAYVHNPDSGREQGYIAVRTVRTDRDAARSVLVDEFSRAASALSRARELAVAFALAEDVEDIIGRVKSIRDKVQEEAIL